MSRKEVCKRYSIVAHVTHMSGINEFYCYHKYKVMLRVYNIFSNNYIVHLETENKVVTFTINFLKCSWLQKPLVNFFFKMTTLNSGWFRFPVGHRGPSPPACFKAPIQKDYSLKACKNL